MACVDEWIRRSPLAADLPVRRRGPRRAARRSRRARRGTRPGACSARSCGRARPGARSARSSGRAHLAAPEHRPGAAERARRRELTPPGAPCPPSPASARSSRARVHFGRTSCNTRPAPSTIGAGTLCELRNQSSAAASTKPTAVQTDAPLARSRRVRRGAGNGDGSENGAPRGARSDGVGSFGMVRNVTARPSAGEQAPPGGDPERGGRSDSRSAASCRSDGL